MDCLCSQSYMRTMAHDLQLCIQHSEHKHLDMGLGIYFSRMLDLMDNLSLRHIQADNLRKGFHNIRIDIGMSQCHFVHDKQHLLHRDLEYKVSNFQQDNQL